MKVSYVKGVANHNGPESCGATREGGVEALTGGRTGRVLSREIYALPHKWQVLRDADAVQNESCLPWTHSVFTGEARGLVANGSLNRQARWPELWLGDVLKTSLIRKLHVASIAATARNALNQVARYRDLVVLIPSRLNWREGVGARCRRRVWIGE